MTKTMLAVALGLLASATAASAHDWYDSDRIDRRETMQDRRIEQGVRSGQITPREYWRLQSEQARIRQMERYARSDGYISGRERAAIEAAQDSASRDIWRQKHDAQRNWWRWW
jgi:hypothetical protein